MIEGEFGAGKPDEAVYRPALGALGMAPDEALMVGDHLEWGVGASQRLGFTGDRAVGSGYRMAVPSSRTGSSARSTS